MQQIQWRWRKTLTRAVSVTPAHHHPYWMKAVDADGRMQNIMTPDRPVSRGRIYRQHMC